jgi:hypothetical protein
LTAGPVLASTTLPHRPGGFVYMPNAWEGLALFLSARTRQRDRKAESWRAGVSTALVTLRYGGEAGCTAPTATAE